MRQKLIAAARQTSAIRILARQMQECASGGTVNRAHYKTSIAVCLFCLAWGCSILFSMTPRRTDADAILEGRLSQKALASHYPWFNQGKRAYTPDDDTVKELATYSRQLRFVVVMGTWCSDSQKHVPPFFKLMEALHVPDKRIALIGVNRNKQSREVDLAPLHVERVPTFIVFFEGKEVGRIVEETRTSLEKDLLEILQLHVAHRVSSYEDSLRIP
jgi:thiol-disulfide isomerase/thioredoxin